MIKENHPDNNVGNIEYIRREDALNAISCDITITGKENAEIVCKAIASFADRIKALPSDDVAPVVRCDDAVSRKAVKSMTCNHCGRIDCEGEDNCIRMIDVSDLPSVVRHKKMGMWVLHTYMPHKKYCSECGEDSPYNKRWIFCPNCGAKMDGEE